MIFGAEIALAAAALAKREALKMDAIYTQSQVEEAWKDYKSTQVLRYMKDGKWILSPLGQSVDLTGTTNASVVKLRDVMSFPKYLKKNYGQD